MLLADESLMRFSRLFCSRWHGLNKASGVMKAMDDKEFIGSLITLLQRGNWAQQRQEEPEETTVGGWKCPMIPNGWYWSASSMR